MNILRDILIQLSDINRRLANVVRYGTVTEVDAANAMAKVTFGGETESAWLPMQVPRAGGARVWAPVVVGEQVMVSCPSGDTAQGVIGGSVPCDAFPAPSSDGGSFRIDLPGGVVIEVAGGEVRITAPGKVKVTGDIEVTGDVVASGISLVHHVHGGVSRGASNTDEPH